MTALSIVAHSHPFVVGVDTHARNHAYAILDTTNGALLDTQQFPTTTAGINRAIKWVARRTNADAQLRRSHRWAGAWRWLPRAP